MLVSKIKSIAKRRVLVRDQQASISDEIGKHKNVPDSEFDSSELEKGIKVEMEHTDNPEIAKNIAKDHLSEIKDYYTRLLAMEEEAKK